MTDDQTIIRRVLEGDVEAFGVIVDRYTSRIYRLARNLVGQADADDLTQDVLVAAFEQLARFDSGRAPFATWLFTITRNKCLNALKRRRPLATGEVEPHDMRTPHDAAEGREWRAQFDEALAALPLDQRTAFIFSELDDLSYQEIARIENVSLGTVKSRVHRAKHKLQRLLDSAERER